VLSGMRQEASVCDPKRVFEEPSSLSRSVIPSGTPRGIHPFAPLDDHRWIPREYVRNDKRVASQTRSECTREGSSQLRALIPTAGFLASTLGMTTFLLATVLLVGLAGCGSPSKANIELRKQNADLRDQISKLQIQREGDQAQIRALETHATTVPSLSISRLNDLSTAHGLKFGRLTGGADLNPDAPGDEGVKAEVIVYDGDGDPIKALGNFTVEAFDLADPNPRIGKWTFAGSDARKNFFSTTFLYAFIFECPWQRVPSHNQITIKVNFTDALTGRTFDAEKRVSVNLPSSPSTAPAAHPATTAAK